MLIVLTTSEEFAVVIAKAFVLPSVTSIASTSSAFFVGGAS